MGTVHAKEPLGLPTPPPPKNNHAVKEIKLQDVTVKVDHVHVEGVKRTKNDILSQHVKEIFTATNFEELVRKAHVAKSKLELLGLFKKVGIFIDVSSGEGSSENGYDVTFDVVESKRMTGGVSTLVGTNEGSLLFSLKLPNTFGRGEKVDAQYTYGTKNTTGFTGVFTKPVNGNPNILLSNAAFKQDGEFPYSGYKETNHGVFSEINFPSIFGSHSLRWDGIWRELNCLTKTTAFTVREQCGHSLKSAIKHTITQDSRDDKVIPTQGYLLRISQEVAGLGGDVNFQKHDVELQLNQPLLFDSVLQGTFAAGFMKTLTPGADIKIQDRFFVGGPLTLRGFNLKGVGPSEDGCSLGGDAYWCSGLHLYTPLPFRPGKGGFGELFRTHFFLNAGNLQNINYDQEMKENLTDLARNLRLTYGVGVILRMGGIARLELNYCWPIKFQSQDSLCPGIQCGIGISFL